MHCIGDTYTQVFTIMKVKTLPNLLEGKQDGRHCRLSLVSFCNIDKVKTLMRKMTITWVAPDLAGCGARGRRRRRSVRRTRSRRSTRCFRNFRSAPAPWATSLLNPVLIKTRPTCAPTPPSARSHLSTLDDFHGSLPLVQAAPANIRD